MVEAASKLSFPKARMGERKNPMVDMRVITRKRIICVEYSRVSDFIINL